MVNYERHQSRNFSLDGRTASVVRNWFVGETDDETSAFLTALNATTPIYDNLVRSGIKGDYQGGRVWYVDITYTNVDPQHVLGGSDPNAPGGPGGAGGTVPRPQGPGTPTEALPPSYSWDTTGGTVRIYQSYGTRSLTFAAGEGTSIDEVQAAQQGQTLENQRAIGISDDKVEGVEVYAAKFDWARDVVRDSVSQQYLDNLQLLTGRINDASFYKWAEGEVLYLGATGRQVNGRWNITHKFSVQKNLENVVVGNGITIPKVRGWEYVWYRYRSKPVGKFMASVPVAAYVEQVVRYGDFSFLGIGV